MRDRSRPAAAASATAAGEMRPGADSTATAEAADGSQGDALGNRARRDLFLLACCQALGQACNTMMFSATGLSVITFYARHDLATLPITMQHVGVMAFVFPAALLMQRMGRRFGFRVGSLFGMTGGAIAGYGLYTSSFLAMCLGGFLLGYAVACLQMYRFAASELAPISYRAKAIAWVTAGGVVAGVVGPTLVRETHDIWMPLYLGTYGALICLHLIVFTIMSFIRFPSVAESMAAANASATSEPVAPPRPLRAIASQPRFIAAALTGMIAFGTMAFLMGASPIAIVACGLPHTEAHWVILMHVLGMFVPSFFTGNLINRFGTPMVMSWGIVLMLLGVGAGLSGMTEWNFRLALTLNGIGWNFLFIGATTLVTTCYRPNERGKTQALNDFLIFGTTAASSFMAGYLQEHMGWYPLNWFSLILLLAAAVAVGWLWVQHRRPLQEAA